MLPPQTIDDPQCRALSRRLRHKLRAASPTPNLLYELMGFGHFVQMAMTRDGLLIGQPHRATGFDAFIGSPTPGMLRQIARIWLELDAAERRLVLERLEEQSIPPARLGIVPTTRVASGTRRA